MTGTTRDPSRGLGKSFGTNGGRHRIGVGDRFLETGRDIAEEAS